MISLKRRSIQIPISRHSFFALAAILCVTAQGCGVDTQESSMDLELTIDKTLHLPTGFAPTGADVSSVGDILLWSSAGRIIEIDGEALVIVNDVEIPQVDLIGARLVGPTGWVELIDGNAQMAIVIDRQGQVKAEHSLSLPVPSLQAVYRRLAWYFLGRIQDSSYAVFRMENGRDARATQTSRIGLVSKQTIWISGLAEAIAVTNVVDPGLGSNIFGEIDQKLQVSSSAMLMEELTADPNALWRSLMPIDLGSGFLQVISDQRSDHRIVVRFAPDGKVQTFSKIDAPLGFIGSVPPTSTLFATRAGTVVDVVRYKWRWLKGPAVPKLEKEQ